MYDTSTCVCVRVRSLSDDPLPTCDDPSHVCTYVFDDLLPTRGNPLPTCDVPSLSCDPRYIHVVWHPLYMCCVKSRTMQYPRD